MHGRSRGGEHVPPHGAKGACIATPLPGAVTLSTCGAARQLMWVCVRGCWGWSMDVLAWRVDGLCALVSIEQSGERWSSLMGLEIGCCQGHCDE